MLHYVGSPGRIVFFGGGGGDRVVRSWGGVIR